MILTFLLGLAAGALVPIAEPRVRAMVEGMAGRKIEIKDSEFDLLTLLILMLIAAVLSTLLTHFGGAISLIIGAGLGVFGKRILAASKGERGGR